MHSLFNALSSDFVMKINNQMMDVAKQNVIENENICQKNKL